MNKRITRKIMAATLVATLFVGGAFAQTHNGTAVPGGAVAANYAASTAVGEGTTYITEGTTVPMYVEPDGYFHPNYDVVAGDWTLSDGFTWTFTGTATTGLTVTQLATDDNYVTVAAGAGDAGNYVLSVTEDAPAAYGGCSGAQVDLNITVVTAPSFSINGNDATYTFCAGDPLGLAPGDINTTIAGGWQQFRLSWNLTITTLYDGDADGVVDDIEFWYDDENGTTQFAVATYAVNHTTDETTDPFEALAAASATHDIMTVGAFNVIDNNGGAAGGDAVTVYTYTLVSVNDQASRYDDFLTLVGDATDAAAFTDYPALAAADQVVVTVFPAPVTGPIFHINSGWAN